MAEKPSYDHVHVGFRNGPEPVANDTGRPEPVLTRQQLDQLEQLVDRRVS